MSRRFTALVVCLLWGCSTETDTRLDLPPLHGARSMIVSVTFDGRFDVYAVSLLDGEAAALIPVPRADVVRLEAVMLSPTLDELGLAAGPIDHTETGEGIEQLGPRAIYAAELTGERNQAGWTQVEQLTKQMADFRVSLRTDCASFESEVYDTGSAQSSAFAVPIDPLTVLIGGREGDVFVVRDSGEVEPVEVSAEFEPTGAYKGPDGELWFGGRGGALWQGFYDGNLVLNEAGRSPRGLTIHWLAGAWLRGSYEVYTLSIDGRLERFGDGSWPLLHEFQTDNNTNEWLGGLSMIRPGELVACSRQHKAIFRTATMAREAVPSLAGVSACVHVPGLGTIVGSIEGQFFVETDREWIELVGSPLDLAVATIVPYEDGFLYGAFLGNLGQYKPGFGFCPLQRPASHGIREIVPLGDGLLLYGDNPNAATTPVTRLLRVD